MMGDSRRGTKGEFAGIAKATNSRSINSREDAMRGADSLLVTHENIAKRAYELYEQGHYQDGHDLTHWLEAEREIVSKSRAMEAS
jgi:hypothetical protein